MRVRVRVRGFGFGLGFGFGFGLGLGLGLGFRLRLGFCHMHGCRCREMAARSWRSLSCSSSSGRAPAWLPYWLGLGLGLEPQRIAMAISPVWCRPGALSVLCSWTSSSLAPPPLSLAFEVSLPSASSVLVALILQSTQKSALPVHPCLPSALEEERRVHLLGALGAFPE